IRPGSPLARARSTSASYLRLAGRAAAHSLRWLSNVMRPGRESALGRSTAAPHSRSPQAPSRPGSVRASAPSRCGDDPCARSRARTAGSASHAPTGSHAPPRRAGCRAGRGCRRAAIAPAWRRADRLLLQLPSVPSEASSDHGFVFGKRTQQRGRWRRPRYRRRSNLRPADCAVATSNTIEMGGVDDPQPATLRLLVHCYLVQSMADPHFAGRDRYRHALANQAPRYRVAVRVDLDGAIIADDAGQFTQGSERGLPAERLQPMYLVAREADDRRLSGRAVDTNVRNLTLPPVEMRLECFPAREGMTGDCVLLHVADAVLGLAFRARPIWCAGARTEAPMFCEGDQLVVELNRSAYRVVAHHERPWIVHQHFLRHTAEGRERALEPGKPMLLPLGPERTHMKPSRVAERCHEHECLDFRSSDLDQALPEVDLQLSSRRRLKPRRRQSLRLQRLAIGLHGALQRPPADCHAFLGQQVLAHHVGIAAMPNEPLAQPTLKAVETLRPLRRLERLHPAGRHVALHRVMAAAQLSRNPLQTPPARPQAQHL